jgi:hypothetical protein
MLPALALSIALSATAVPPGAPVANHAQPGHDTQPTVQIFEREAVDNYRRANWLQYNAELERLWQIYRAAGSTPLAWQAYQASAEAAKYRYLYADPYLLPVVRTQAAFLPPWEQVIQNGSVATGAACIRP